ncbi:MULTISPECIES: phage tail tube protein [unclassified Thioalkalivibrio]|uniref:phage tail tube protein n=1 Tax=unclassified Thioalkalivibrio TaxID=2621013 RepID=UPI0003802135|nr:MULTISPECIES: phage tail tube protein [unclassified Thioalkalivibrio]
MAKLIRKRFVDVALETEYGKDPGADRVALLPNSDLSLTVEGNTVTRDTVRDTLSPQGHVVVDRRQEVSLPLELRGAGLDENDELKVPETDVLLRASAFEREDGARLVLTSVSGDFKRGETVQNTTAEETAGTVADWDPEEKTLYLRDLQAMPDASDELEGEDSEAAGTVDAAADAWVYRPASPRPNDQDSVYLRYDLDGNLHKVAGARATFSLNITRAEIPQITFTLSGKYLEPAPGGPISGEYLDQVPTPALGARMTIGNLDMQQVAVNSVQADMANEVQPRNDMQAEDGFRGFLITERDPTGSVDPEVTGLGDFNPYKDWSQGNYVAIAAGIGTGAGRRVRLVMPRTQYTQLPYDSRNGIATYDLGFRATGEDDELMLVYS